MNDKPYFLAIVGPTATGKSQLAINIAKQCRSQIISMDSMQIYKQMNIGTAKISSEEMQNIPHAMLDIVEPYENFTVGDYVAQAKELIVNYNQKNILPILVGGTALYLRALIQNFGLGEVNADPAYREKLYKLAQTEEGKLELHSLLSEIDPQAAMKLHPNDVRRVVRALEVYKISGQKFSDQADKKNDYYEYCLIGLQDDRSLLYERINKRVFQMFEQGLEDEVKALLKCGLDFQNQSMRGIGYKEFEPYIQGKISKDELIHLIQLNSRHYAKRQLTFFKSFPTLQWIDILQGRVLEDAMRIITNSNLKEQIIWTTKF